MSDDNATSENKSQKSDHNSQSFEDLFNQSLSSLEKQLKVGDKIKSEILSISKDVVYVTTGTPSDGQLMKSDLLNEKGEFPYKVGDYLDLYVTQQKGGKIFLSLKPTSKNISDDLEDAFDMLLPVEGRITEECPGGVRVNLMGKNAFCPISQLDLKRVESTNPYIGKKFEFYITQWKEGGKNIVLSRKKLLEEALENEKDLFWEDSKEGDLVHGTVTRIEKFGAFVEIKPNIEGLVHISEVSWSRIAHPDEILQLGQKVSALIIKKEMVDDHRLKISLSIKQASVEPWTLIKDKFQVGSVVKGKVERKEIFGLFIQLEPGITGLLPKAVALASPQFPYDKCRPGDEVTVRIAQIQPEERRMSLSVPEDPDADSWKGYTNSSDSKQAGNSTFGTLGSEFQKLFEKK